MLCHPFVATSAGIPWWLIVPVKVIQQGALFPSA
jgi:hypothetical protein